MACRGVMGGLATHETGPVAWYPGGMDDATTPPGKLVPDAAADRREAAYALWAWKLDRNAAEVGRALGVPARTVQRWAADGGWRERHAAERRSLGRRAWAAAELRLLGIVDEVLARQVRIALGQGDRVRTLTKRGEAVEVDLPVPYQAQVNAQNSLLDRLGLVAGARPPAPAEDEERAQDDDDDEPTDPQDAAERHRRRLERMRKQHSW